MRKVIFARLHSTFHIPGWSQFGPAMSEKESAGKSFNADMFKVDGGLLLVRRDTQAEMFIPDPNIQILQYAPEEKKPVVKAAPKAA